MIKNITKNVVITKETRVCKTLGEKATGLMFSMRNPNLGLIFNFETSTMISIHMLFVFYPIDVIWLDQYYKVVWIKKDFWPFVPYYRPKYNAHFMIETISGVVEKTKTEIGDTLNWDKNTDKKKN